MSEIFFSSIEGLNKHFAEKGADTPTGRAIANNEIPLTEGEVSTAQPEVPEELRGKFVAEMVKRYGHLGYVPTLDEYKYYDAFVEQEKKSMFAQAGEAMANTFGDLGAGAYELGKDVLQLKVPKVVGSGIEGAVVGTKNWMYMYQEAKYDRNSWLGKLLFNTSDSVEDKYLAFQQALEVRRMIHKEQEEGAFLPPTIEVGGMKLDLYNPAVVKGLSYVADPSWLMPNLGIESAIAKGLRGATKAIGLGESLSKASAYAMKKTSEGFGKLGDASESVSNAIGKFDRNLSETLSNMTGHDHNITSGGRIQGREGIVRSSENALGVDKVKIPAWAPVTATWGITKLTEGVARLGEISFKLLSEDPKFAGLTLSERIAAESTSPSIKKVAHFWSQTGTPFIDWVTESTKTGLHSSMYGGAFGLAFGGEEGLYHGLGTGFAIGSSFHQIGVVYNTVSGGNAVNDTLKHFLWATQHYDRHNQEGLMRLLANADKEAGIKGQLSVMSQIAASERLLRDTKILVLTEDKIKEMSTSIEWNDYERRSLADPEFGGITFLKDKDNTTVILINADKAAKSVVNEETFHGIMLQDRYGKAFTKSAIDALVGTEDRAGALYRMPKETAVSLLEQFRDQYFNLQKDVTKMPTEGMAGMYKRFNEAIEAFKNGEKPSDIRGFFEEFLASYWNRFVEEKPLDYLLKGGDLGIVRNAIEGAKDTYRNIMARDLSEAGVQLIKGETPDMFLIDQRTKQRVRIPLLEKLMKHYVRELKSGMYDGWEINNKKYATTETLLNSEFDHLLKKDIETGLMRPITEDELNAESTKRIANLVEDLLATDPSQRGLKIELVNESGETTAQYSPAPAKKKKKKQAKEKEPETTKIKETTVAKERAWFKQHAKRNLGTDVSAGELSEMGPNPRGTKPKVIEREVGVGRWSLDKTGDFWESVWESNPRLRITGLATKTELNLFEKHLGAHTASRLRDLNYVIEKSRVGRMEEISNIMRSTVLTYEKENDDGTRERGVFVEQRRFIPVELNLYFEQKPIGKPKDGIQKYRVGRARLLTTVFDWDAYLKREDYMFNRIDDGELHFKAVRNLFGTQQNLRQAVRDLLTNYSMGHKAEAGLKFFSRGKGGDKDAALRRDIVNATIGYHPTKEMMKKRKWKNYPLEAQLRGEQKVEFPTVMTSFRVDRMTAIVAEEGEGFRYDHINAYPRSQANFSPAVSHRDNNGNVLQSGAFNILRDTIYRNREGEHIAVYALRTPTSEILERGGVGRVFDFVDPDFASNLEEMLPRLRGSQYYSRNGWLHFTPDIHEAGFYEDKKMRVGYIDTQTHLNLSDIPFGSDWRYSVESVAKRISVLTEKPLGDVMEDILRITDDNGVRVFDHYKGDTDIRSSSMPTLDEWLFSPKGKSFLSKYKIHSIEYMNINPISGNEFSTVAIYEPSRFIENRGVKNLDDFMFSPSKTIADRYRDQLAKSGTHELSGLLKYRIDEKGEVVERVRGDEQVTEKYITNLVKHNQMLVDDAIKYIEQNKVYSPETHKQFKAFLIPRVQKLLKEKFPRAPLYVLEAIAQYSIDGFVKYTEAARKVKGKQLPAVSLVADSVLVENARKYGVTPAKIAETGLMSLGNWVEMSEAEYLTLKNYKKWGQLLEKTEAEAKRKADYEIENAEQTKKADIIKNTVEKRLADYRRREGLSKERMEDLLAMGESRQSLVNAIESMRLQIKNKETELMLSDDIEERIQIETKIKELQNRIENTQLAIKTRVNFEKLTKIPEVKVSQYKLTAQERANIRSKIFDRRVMMDSIIQKVLRDNNGITGLADNIAERQKQLVFLMDASLVGIGRVGNDNIKLSSYALKNLREAFMERNATLARKLLKSERGYARREMQTIVDAFDAIEASKVPVSQQAIEAKATYERHTKEIEAIVSNDAKQQILDVLTAYHISEIAPDTLEKVRAKLYDEASKGLIELGSPEAIARSVELYTFFETNGKDTVRRIQDSIKLNYVKATEALEKEGFVGVKWQSFDLTKTQNQFDSGNGYKTARKAWYFDGTRFMVADQVSSTDSGVLVMYDQNGDILLQKKYKEYTVNNLGAKVLTAEATIKQMTDLFLKQATQIIRNKAIAGEVPANILIEGPYQKVEGNLKKYILALAKADIGKSAVPDDGYVLHRNGDYFVAQELHTDEIGFDVPARIKQLQKQLDENLANARRPLNKAEKEEIKKKIDDIQFNIDQGRYVNDEAIADAQARIEKLKGQIEKGFAVSDKLDPNRKLTPDERVEIRDSITKLNQYINQDLGFSFVIDNNYKVHIIKREFGSLTERNKELADMAVNKGRNSHIAFEKFAQESYLRFDNFLRGKRSIENQMLSSILGESGKSPHQVVPQIRELMAKLQEIERQQRGFYREARKKINEARRKNSQKPLSDIKIVEQLKAEMNSMAEASNTSEAMHLAAAQQLYEMGVLQKMQNMTPEAVEELLFRVSAKSREVDLTQFHLPVPKDGNVIGMINQLQKQFYEQGSRFSVMEDRYQKMHDGLYGKSDETTEIKTKIDFLARRYLWAKGIHIAKATDFITKASLHQFDVVSAFDYMALRRFRPKTGVEYGDPKYLADVENVLGKGHENYRSLEDYADAFKSRILDLKSYYDQGIRAGDISMKRILGIDLKNINSEISISHNLRRSITKDNLGDEAYAWINDPRRESRLRELDKDIVDGRIDYREAIGIIKDEYLLSTIGKNGVELRDTVNALNETLEKIAIISNRLNIASGRVELRDAIVLGDGTGQTLEQYRKNLTTDPKRLGNELLKLREKKEALQKRYEKILQKAGDADAPPEFKRLVAEYRHFDYAQSVAKKNIIKDRKLYRQLERMRQKNIVDLFRQYDDFARNLGIPNIKDSRIEIHPEDPRTQYVYYAFPELSMQFNSARWRMWDLTTTSTNGLGGVHSGRAELPTTEFKGNPLKNWIITESKEARQTIYLADYIHFANAKKQMYESNPNTAMSAADANLIKFFFPKESTKGVLKRLIDAIPEERMREHEALKNGILDTFKNDTERNRFIRSFVADAFDLISNNQAIREMALKKLKGMTDEEFAAWKDKYPVDFDKSIKTREVIEQAMYLVKKGRIPITKKGEPFNYRDSVHTILSPDDLKKLYEIGERLNYTNEYIQQLIDEGPSENTPAQIRNILGRKKAPFATRHNVGHIPVDTLIRMQGFDEIWKTETQWHKMDSLFGRERNFGVKAEYEKLSPDKRFNLDVSQINRMMLANEANNIKAARELRKRYKQQNKAILGDETIEDFHFGETGDIIKDEYERVQQILGEALKTDASINAYKERLTEFISARPKAVANLLSIDDNLRISGAVRGKDNQLIIDWHNKNKPNYRDTLDGRYFVRRIEDKNKSGRVTVSYEVLFAGETFKTLRNKTIHKLDTMRIGLVNDITEAQVLIRFFEDDVMKIKTAANLVEGGKNAFDEFRVGDQPLPVQDPTQNLLLNWSNASLFAKQVMELYMENKGKPYYRQLMADKFEAIGQYGEMQYLRWETSTGTYKRKMVITPSKEGILKKYFEERISPDGHKMWVRIKQTDKPADPNLVSKDKEPTQEQATRTEDARETTPEEKTVSDATTFSIVQESIPSEEKPFKDFVVLQNRLGYTIVKLEQDRRSVYRVFNPASAFMSQVYNEIEAVEEILKAEMKQYDR